MERDTESLGPCGDDKSVILMILEDGAWHKYRLPKGSHSYARCFCHELEHLDGHLYTEHIDHFLSDEELRKYLEAEEGE